MIQESTNKEATSCQRREQCIAMLPVAGPAVAASKFWDKFQYNDIISYMRVPHIISHINHATSQQCDESIPEKVTLQSLFKLVWH